MAKVDQCEFCGRDYIGICACVSSFGKNVERKMGAWRVLNGRKAFPPKIQAMFRDGKWRKYRLDAAAEKLRVNQETRASRHAATLAKRAQTGINRALGRKFGPDMFQVTLKSTCTRVPTY